MPKAYKGPQKLSEVDTPRKSRQPASQLSAHPAKTTTPDSHAPKPSQRFERKHSQTVPTKRTTPPKAAAKEATIAPVAGIVTKIEAQKRHKDRYNIYIDETFAFGVSEATLAHFAIFKDQTVSKERSLTIQKYEAENQLFERALHYLSRALHTRQQVSDKLKILTQEERLITQTLARLEEMGFVNDRLYAESYTRTAMTMQNKGPKKIRQELKLKGVSEADIAAGLKEYDEASLANNLHQLANKKYQAYKRRHSQTESLQKTRQFLYQKGFAGDAIQNAIADLKEETVDDAQEWALLLETRDKYWRRYQRQEPKQRLFKVKQQLFKKGFASEQIAEALEALDNEEE